MYEAYFGISGSPFQLGPDQSFYFDSRPHRETLGTLRRGLEQPNGFVMLTGEVGAGKTTVMARLIESLDASRFHVGQIMYSQLDADELLCAMLVAFGGPLGGDSPEEWRAAIDSYLDANAERGRRAVLVEDEAQNLHSDALLRLAELDKARIGSAVPLKVFLVGQPELRSVIDTADLAALRERVVVECQLGPLNDDETGPYIRHRLERVGWKGRPAFTADAFGEIHRWTAGVPRRINMLCNRLMLSCFLGMLTDIDAEMVERTARGLRAESGDASEPPPRRPALGGMIRAAEPRGETAAPSVARATDRPPEILKETARPPPVPVLESAAEDETFISPEMPSLTEPESGAESRPLLCVVGGQGDHVKAAALMHALAAQPGLPVTLLVRCYANGAFDRHRDMFEGLDIAGRLVSLGIAISTFAGRAAELMKRFEFVVDRCPPAAVIVFDGTDAALSCGLVAKRKGIPVLHVGAGQRSRANADAADITRRLVDQLADALYTADAQASKQLAHEGVAADRISFVGNPLADALQIALRTKLAVPNPRERLGLPASVLSDRNGYGVVVLDAMPNVGDREVFSALIDIVRAVAHDVPLVWPMHKRTREQLARFKLDAIVASERIATLPSQSYSSLVQLMSNATCVLTDSLNVQEEATVLSIPCLTIGVGQDRDLTTAIGSNIVVGRNKALATRAVWDCIFNGGKRGRVPELWDGRAATRIAEHMAQFFESRRRARAGATV